MSTEATNQTARRDAGTLPEEGFPPPFSPQRRVGSSGSSKHPIPRTRSRGPIHSDKRLLDKRDLVDFTRLSEATIDRLIASGEFPKPFEVRSESNRATLRWTLGSVEAWVRRKSEAT